MNMNPQSCFYRKYISDFILQKRDKLNKSDINNSPHIDHTTLEMNEEYQDKEYFYLLPQRYLLKHFHNIWSGTSDKDIMKVTDSDRVRVMGLLFSEDLFEYIPSVMPLKSSKKNILIDGYAPSKLRAHNLLFNKFIDEEEKVVVPMKWNNEKTKTYVDGAY